MIRTTVLAALSILCLACLPWARASEPTIDPLLRTVDLDIGQEADVTLGDGSSVNLRLLDIEEIRDDLRHAVRLARATVVVNRQRVTITSANYNLPVKVGNVQIDCAVTRGCVQPDKNPWALDADARFRLWPADSKWIRPGTFVYPAKQRWFASDTQMSNEPTFVDGGERPARKEIYYHWGLDMGGAEGLVSVVAATDGLVVSAGVVALEGQAEDTPVRPRYDVVYVQDGRGWYYRYSHLHTMDAAIKPGSRVKMGQPIGRLGKEGGSGGWSHLHFDISARQPSGRYGIVEGYAFLWQAYHDGHGTMLQAVARPHQVTWVGDTIRLDGSKSFSREGPHGISRYDWTFSDGTTASGTKVERRYLHVGQYSEILQVTDLAGRVDYDFTRVLVLDRDHPDQLPPAIHVAYYPTFGMKAGDEITFKVRSFAIGATEGHESWDFGDGSPAGKTQSDGNQETHAKDGYAVITHRYRRPGHYLVRVQRTNLRGQQAVGHVHLRVGASE